ncbi:MAG TPA: helix-turn-helix domain-containing protein, partial [Prosthecobacter sp.]|nr:helix-turn-helix domain-containing protein [Prosthecobacter sp.]
MYFGVQAQPTLHRRWGGFCLTLVGAKPMMALGFPPTFQARTGSTPAGTRMGSFGERLQREREMRGVTLDEIAESTKISARSLRAIEEEHFDQLPGGIFNKGFVRAYARYLGIDEEQAVADYVIAEEAHRQEKAGKVAEIVAQAESQVPVEPSNRTWHVVAAAAVLLVLGVGGWNYYNRGKSTDVSATVQAQEVTANTSSAPEAPASEPVAAPAPVVTASETEQAAAVSEATEFTVVLRAKEKSWVSVSTDGNNVLEGL